MTVTFVIGAAASGKSAYAESLCLGHDGPRVYLATMEPFGEEGARRIARHRALREGKGFSTLERTRDVGAAVSGLPRGCTLLLEDVGNLVANELFAEGGLSPRDPDAAAREVLGGIERLAQAAAHTVVVTVDVFADGMRYDEGTEAWRRALARVNAGVAALADAIEEQKPALPDGSPMTVERLQLMGSDFGMKPSFERMHWIIDHAFVEGDGTLSCGTSVSDSFLMRAFERTNTRTNPLYWTLQEFIYADGDTMPIRWAAAEEKAHRAEFDTLARPLMFTGEAMFPWTFEQMPELKPFKPAMDLLMEDTSWDKIYDPQRLACNEVPLQAAVYFDDMYVDSGMQLDTLSRVGNSHAWVTNEFEHDGLHGSVVFKHLFDEALNRGDLRRIF